MRAFNTAVLNGALYQCRDNQPNVRLKVRFMALLLLA